VLSVHGNRIKVTEVVRDGDNLTFIIISQKYDDFDWLQQHLFCQEEVPGIQGIIILALGDWKPYGAALERFLQQVASHSVLSKNKAVEDFLTSSEPPGRQKTKKNIFNRLSQAVEGMRKEGHKKFLDVVQTEQKHMGSVAENNMNTLGLGLDLEARYQEAEMLFRRTCKLVELETAKRNAEKAKMEEVKKTTEAEFSQISAMAKQEIKHFKQARVQMLQQALVLWCEKQLVTA
uniref:Uncharacterized protein n=1 Tax=Periophthalmus magnuspinnatus TaxID=409849 RepID=A0A3B4A859_9GOBI